MLQFIFLAVLIYFIAQTLYTWHYFSIGMGLAKISYARKTNLGSKTKPVFKLFIAGDSVGAGVAASSFEKSVAGQIGNHFAKDHFVEFENISRSGNKVEDVLTGKAPEEKQDLIVLIVSSNNLFHLTSTRTFQGDVINLFSKFTNLGKKVILIGPGRVAGSPAIPIFLRLVYLFKAPNYAEILENEAKKYENVVYINPLKHQAEVERYGQTFAADKFHPNDSGHRYWFDMIATGF